MGFASVRRQVGAIFNPADDRMRLAKSRLSRGGSMKVYLRLDPDESLLLQIFENEHKGKPYKFYDPVNSQSPVAGTWKVEFIESRPVLPRPVKSAGPAT